MPVGTPGATPGRPSTSVRMLAAYFDASADYHSGVGGSTASAALQGLRLESHILLNSSEVEEKLASISQVPPWCHAHMRFLAFELEARMSACRAAHSTHAVGSSHCVWIETNGSYGIFREIHESSFHA